MAADFPEWRRWLGAAIDIVYARHCVACGASVEVEHGHLCWECRRTMELVVEPFCSRCGDPADGMVQHEYRCSACCDREPAFALARSAVRYRGAARHMIQSFKYGNMPCLVPELAELLLATWQAHCVGRRVDLVTCVPLHTKRERTRGYNQAALLGRQLARWLHTDFDDRRLMRSRETRTQTDLDAGERRRNVKQAFTARADGWTAGRTLLLVDDVMTTGATVRECASTLVDAGAKEVLVLTVARG